MTPLDSRHRQDPEDADAFLAAVLRAIEWIQENTRTVVIGAVVVVAAVAAVVYYQNYREDVRQQAASQLQQLQTRLQGRTSPDSLARTVQGFIDRFGDTRYGDEARLLMARIHLTNESWKQAVSVLEPVVSSYPANVPMGYAARKLQAAGQEAAGNTEQALRLYADLARNAQFPFQRNEAAADRARLLAETGRLSEAETIYARLASEADTGAAGVASRDLQTYRLKLGEIRARLAGDGGGTGAPGGVGARGREAPAPSDTAGAPMGG